MASLSCNCLLTDLRLPFEFSHYVYRPLIPFDRSSLSKWKFVVVSTKDCCRINKGLLTYHQTFDVATTRILVITREQKNGER